jgi:hypothetical protein
MPTTATIQAVQTRRLPQIDLLRLEQGVLIARAVAQGRDQFRLMLTVSRPDSVSNLSASMPRDAMRSTISPRLPRSLNCSNVVWCVVKERGVWQPHSLHTAEATGSKPVTPTSTNAFIGSHPRASCQQIASKPPRVAVQRCEC